MTVDTETGGDDASRPLNEPAGRATVASSTARSTIGGPSHRTVRTGPGMPPPRRGPVPVVVEEDDLDSDDDSFDEEPRCCCTPRGRVISAIVLLLVGAISVSLAVTQPWARNTSDSSDPPGDPDECRWFWENCNEECMPWWGNCTELTFEEERYCGGMRDRCECRWYQETCEVPCEWWWGNCTMPDFVWCGERKETCECLWWEEHCAQTEPCDWWDGNCTTTKCDDFQGTCEDTWTNRSFVPTAAPNIAGSSVDATTARRYQDITRAVSTSGTSETNTYTLSPDSAFNYQPQTDQQRVLNWLVFDDPARLNGQSYPRERILQRYAAALLYTRARGQRWVNQAGWMSGQHECTWYGVVCETKEIASQGSSQATVWRNEYVVTELHLQNNNLATGFLPQEFFYVFKDLTVLGLYGNGLAGTIPSEIGRMTSLKRLWIDSNSMRGSLPTELGLLTDLEQLDIFGNSLNGQLPSQLGNLRNLKRFSAYGNFFTGTIPQQFGAMSSLVELFLDGNLIGGSIPFSLGYANNLEDLRLHNNVLNGKLPPELGLLPKLRVFYVDNNALTGTIPANAVRGWTSLADFEAFENNLIGSIPSEFGALLNLKVLQLKGNNLMGQIPAQICNGGLLQKIELTDNELGGTIPDLSNCKVLKRLHLGDNAIGGSIPASIGELSQLLTVHLDNNNLNGGIPVELANLPALTNLTVDNNGLVGTMPNAFCSRNPRMLELSSDCGDSFNSLMKCSCCTLCCSSRGGCIPQATFRTVPP